MSKEISDEVKPYLTLIESLAQRITCPLDSWQIPGMGSGLPFVWKGCKVYHSDDPEEYCCACELQAVLQNGIPQEERRLTAAKAEIQQLYIELNEKDKLLDKYENNR